MVDAITAHQMIEEYAEHSPDHIALIEGETCCTYEELNCKANQIANYLLEQNISRGKLIALAIEPSSQLLVLVLAILKTGNGYLPLDARHPKTRLQFILKDCGSPLLITQSQTNDNFIEYAGPIINIDEVWHELKTYPITVPNCLHQANNLAYVIYTSGSTGNPKGVLIEHKSVVNYINWFKNYTECEQQDRIDFSSSIIFDMAVTSTITALALGMQIVICKEEIKKNARQYLLYLNNNNINIVKLTPSYFKTLIEEANHDVVTLSHLNTIILGGEILYSKDCLAWLKHYPRHIIYNEYGPTETTVAVTQFKVTAENIYEIDSIVPIGKPGPNVNCFLLNEDNTKTPAGEIGELYIEGPCVARGYLNQQDLNNKKFINADTNGSMPTKVYRSGDLCRYLKDGNLEFVGRIDGQVKIRGFRVELNEIENCFEAHHMIKACKVVARRNKAQDTELVAYYILKDANIFLPQDEIYAYLTQHLVDYMLPSFFISVQSFPLNENGKLDIKSLPEPQFDEKQAVPETEIESQLTEIWQKEFHMDNIGIHTNFFSLGGHSLMGMRIISAIEKKFIKKISLHELYVAATIHKLSILIRDCEGSHDDEIKNQLFHDVNAVPLSDFQFMFWISNLFEPNVNNLSIIARRRLIGEVDTKAMNDAFNWVVKKHKIFSSRISKYSPLLYLNENDSSEFIIVDLSNNDELDEEAQLVSSLNDFINQGHRKKNPPTFIMKLFLLKSNIYELQIKVSHMFFDDASEEVLFNDLSFAYLNYKNGISPTIGSSTIQYSDYIRYEKNKLNQYLERDIDFWSGYLQDTSLLTLPASEIILNMKNIPFSSYIKIPNEMLEIAKRISIFASVSVTEILCSAIALTFKQLDKKLNKSKIFINIIRSTRDNHIFDEVIGCCLRLDPVKLDINTDFNLVELSRSIQRARIKTDKYQNCSGMAKLACLNRNYRTEKIKYFFAQFFINAYCKLFSKFHLDQRIIMMYTRLSSLRTKKQFLVNLNLLNNFIFQKNNQVLFDSLTKHTKAYQYDLSKINNVLDICITKNKESNITYLVISGNLKPSFREWIGNQIIETITEAQDQLRVDVDDESFSLKNIGT